MTARQCADSSRMVSAALTANAAASSMLEPGATCASWRADARSAPPARPVSQGGRYEALLCAWRLLALAPYRDARGGREPRPRAGQQSGKEDQIRRRLLD